ncbi:unnamed protein product, partial [marine sediment metagenome]
MLFLGSRRPLPEPEDLRTEYYAAEQHVSVLSSAGFQSAAIVLGGSIAGLAVLLAAIGTRGTAVQPKESLSESFAVAVSVLAVGAFFLVGLWRYNWRRYQTAVQNHWARMRDIERQRRMRKNIYLYLLTLPQVERVKSRDWRCLSHEERSRFLGDFKPLPVPMCRILPASGQDVLQATATLVQIAWLLTIPYVLVE